MPSVFYEQIYTIDWAQLVSHFYFIFRNMSIFLNCKVVSITFQKWQVVYLVLYHVINSKSSSGNWKKLDSCYFFQSQHYCILSDSVARCTISNPAWQSCCSCPCVNVILAQFFSSQAIWADAYVLCINSKLILRELWTEMGDTMIWIWWFFFLIVCAVQSKRSSSMCDLLKCQHT